MPDNLTAASRAAGFGATTQTTDNSETIASKLDEVRDLLIEDGMDPATAEALTNYARPATPAYAGNLADLNRMGQIAVTGKVDTPPGEADIEATSLDEAFAVPPNPDLNTGLQTPMGEIDAEGRPTGGTVGDAAQTGDVSTGADYESMTKADLQATLDDRGIEYSASETKSELIEKLS